MHMQRGTRQHVVRTTIWSSIVIGLVALSGITGTGVLRTSPAHAASLAMGSGMETTMIAASKAIPLTVLLHKKVVRVTITNFTFRPARLEVSRGTRIIWTNQDSDPHTVSSSKGIWSSEALDTDGTFARAFTKDGTFPYYCKIHPFMQATVIVKG
jgi:plastocyanin